MKLWSSEEDHSIKKAHTLKKFNWLVPFALVTIAVDGELSRVSFQLYFHFSLKCLVIEIDF